MAGDAAVFADLAMESAAQYQPFVDARAEARLIALVGLEVVGRDPPGRSVDEVGLGEAALIHLVRRVLQQTWIVVHDGFVNADRLNHAKLIEDENQIREDTEMRRSFRDDL